MRLSFWLTVNSQKSTVKSQQSKVNGQKSTVKSQRSKVNGQKKFKLQSS